VELFNERHPESVVDSFGRGGIRMTTAKGRTLARKGRCALQGNREIREDREKGDSILPRKRWDNDMTYRSDTKRIKQLMIRRESFSGLFGKKTNKHWKEVGNKGRFPRGSFREKETSKVRRRVEAGARGGERSRETF